MIIVKSRRIRVLLSQSPDGAVNSGTQAIVQRYEGIFKLGANNISITEANSRSLEMMSQLRWVSTKSPVRGRWSNQN